jgi:hypothetical protein
MRIATTEDALSCTPTKKLRAFVEIESAIRGCGDFA